VCWLRPTDLDHGWHHDAPDPPAAAHVVSRGAFGHYALERISALQLQAKLGIGSYKTAWLLLHKLRKAMVDPERDPLEGMVEVDESSIVYRTKDDPVAGGQGRSAEGKILIAAAVETLPGSTAGRIRLTMIKDYSAATLQIPSGRVSCARVRWAGVNGISLFGNSTAATLPVPVAPEGPKQRPRVE
jgi:hypothetical protein